MGDSLSLFPGQRVHQPADKNGDADERKEYEYAITQLFARRVFRDQSEHNGNEESENRKRAEVRHVHGLRPLAISNASRTVR